MIVAGLTIMLLAIGVLTRAAFRVPRLYADAAIDHHREIVERQTRVWFNDAAAIESLAEQQGFHFSVIQALSGDGYSLEKGRICQLEGRPYLHLVFTDGAREISAYLRSRKAPGFSPLATADVGAEHLAIVNGVHVTALFVTDRAVDVTARARSAAPVL
jgi:hypothetical protein